MQPNASKTLEIALALGSYLLICNVAGHYAAGRVAPFSVGGGQCLLRVLEAKRQLVGIELFRAAAEAMTLQLLDDRAQARAFFNRSVALLCDSRGRLGMPCPFGQQQRAQSFWIGRERVGVSWHSASAELSQRWLEH